MKILLKTLIFGLFASLLLGFAPLAFAATPILSATYQGGNSGSLQITVSNANSFSQIDLYERQTSSLWTTISNIGQTDGSGYFNQTISLAGDGSSNALQMYVVVGGLQSSTVSAYPNSGGNCGYYGCGSGGLTLSQSSLNLAIGQRAAVSITNSYYNYSNSFYISSNSNSSVASASISGSQLNVYGYTGGTTNIIVCSNSGGSSCATLYVTVGNNGCYNSYGCGSGNISLSPSSLNLTSGQTSTVTIYSNGSNSYGSYYISSNNNSSIASAYISGSQLSVSGISAGNSNIIVCQNSGGSGCATLYVTVTGSNCGYYGCNNGTINLSQTSLSLNSGQSSTISIYSNNSSSGSYYISSNSNSSVASAYISGSSLYVTAIASGNTTISICQNSGGSGCATLYLTVNGNSGNGSVWFNTSNPSLYVGQTLAVSINSNNNNSGYYYLSSNSNSGVVSASVSGTILNLYAYQNGSSTIIVCNSGQNACGTLYVTVSGTNNCSSGNNCGSLSLSQTSLNLSLSQSSNVTIYGSGNYYISSNSNSSVASASVSGSTIYVFALQNGNTTISICQNSGGLGCASLQISVGNNCGYYGCGSGTISLSPTSLNITSGQSSTVTIYSNGSYSYGSYTISSNSNSSVASAYISGSSLYVTGIASGNTTFTICQNSGGSGCGTLYVSVNGNGSCGYYGCGSGSLTLSPSSLNVAVGQNSSVNISGSGSYYISSNSTPSVASASLNGNTLNLYGSTPGSSTISVCQSSYNSCASLYVTVGSSSGSGGGLQYPGGGGVLGASTYPNGELIAQGQTVYIVYKNTETAFANSGSFLGFGFKFGNVFHVDNSGLANSGYVITTASASHPWGSWIKSGSTVYFVTDSGLIPIPDWNTFLNNGGQIAWIVPANYYDLRLPILSPMVYGDSRLQ